jgi:nitrogen fixation protein NifX
MRIAFASSNGQVVDQHFGGTERFYLWEVGPERAEAVGQVSLCANGADQQDKIVARADALVGCTMVYTTQIGGPAAAKLVGRRIHPSKASMNTPIADAIADLQAVLRGKPPPWLRKAAGLAEPNIIERADEADD